MTIPLTVANMRRTLGELDRRAKIGMQQTVTAVALAGEKQAKINVSNGSHRKGTKTPAVKPNGPARISGNLFRNITHEPTVWAGTVCTSRVGVAKGAPYGKWVEDLGYEFMKPTAAFLRTIVIPTAERSLHAAFRR